jgi:hypothetical protein
MRQEHAALHDVANEDWGDLLGHLLDLSGQLISASTDAIIAERVRVLRTVETTRAGNRWATVDLGRDGRRVARLVFCEQGLESCGWVTDDAEPEREVFAVRDRGGERELLILLERE